MAGGNPLQPLLQGDPLRPSDADLMWLTDMLGHVFARPELAAEALTHRGTLEHRKDLKAAFPHGNERLEFLGDRVLSLAMANFLLRRFIREREGQIGRRHAELVSARTIGEIADAIGLRDHMITYRGAPPATPGILADMLEALLGAVFLDGGFEPAAQVVERLWGSRLASHNPVPQPPKAMLQEWAMGRGLSLPVYREISREGLEHEPTFLVEVEVETLPLARGKARTKREAETAAAAALLEQIAKK